MECEKRGMLAVSMAGHDRGKVYVVWSETEDTVLLTDGDLRPLAKPKKKKQKAYTDNQKKSGNVAAFTESAGHR